MPSSEVGCHTELHRGIAQRFALILLDCCASGTANTSEGNGVTEIISACAWNQIANGVGPYSLTNALVIELEALKWRTNFSIGELYRNIYLRTQNRMPEQLSNDGRNLERHPAPIHLVLTQDPKKPRSIQLSVLVASRTSWHPWGPFRGSREVPVEVRRRHTSGIERSLRSQALDNRETFPRLAFAVRLQESFSPNADMETRFVEWLRDMPVIGEEVKIEAGFESFSTLIVLSIPFAYSAYIPFDPALISLGPICSDNMIRDPALTSRNSYSPKISKMGFTKPRSMNFTTPEYMLGKAASLYDGPYGPIELDISPPTEEGKVGRDKYREKWAKSPSVYD